MKILLIRLMGLGDVASILIPAVKIIRQRFPDAQIDVLTYEAGCELMSLVEDVHAVLQIEKAQWPDDISEALQSFFAIAQVVTDQGYDRIINYDTWFMPCVLAQCLQEMGEPVEGNTLKISLDELLARVETGQLTQEFVSIPGAFMRSTFAGMDDWYQPWWERHQEAYPQFYLNHCCGYEEAVDISLPLAFEPSEFANAKGQKVIALATSGRVASKQYPHAEALRQALEAAGYYVWGQFDGSVPMLTTLSRFHHTELLVSVPTATQWLAKLAGCPSLIIPGPLPPTILGAEVSVGRTEECQYCFQAQCINGSDFSCMNVAPATIVDLVNRYLGGC